MTFGVLPSAEQIPEFSPKQISALLVDEASQVWSALGLLADAKLPNLKRVHLFGDDKQLPPVLAPCDKSQRAIMASKHVQSLYDVAKFGGHKLHELYVQHRMPAVLADFISRRIYDGLLQSAAHVSTARNAVTWMGAAHGRMSHPGQSQSPFNNTEARLVDRLVRKLDLLLGAAGTGVILTPFTGQRRELERVCTRSRNNGGRWDVKTVDSFQGREADFVVVSLVRTDGIAGFLKDDRRNNVMLSRARRHLFVVGHHQAWARVKGSALWREFAEQFPPAPNCEALCTNLDITRALQLCAE
jgi:superfamily I DNA and/or RNA helicase